MTELVALQRWHRACMTAGDDWLGLALRLPDCRPALSYLSLTCRFDLLGFVSWHLRFLVIFASLAWLEIGFLVSLERLREHGLFLRSAKRRPKQRPACLGFFVCARAKLGPMRWLAPMFALCVLAGCTSIGTELRMAQVLYKDARYEDAQLWLVELQHETASMSSEDLARFYYLRGMTGFRLGQREDALHFLVLAEQLDAEAPGRLPAAWRPVLARTLAEIMPTSASPHARNPFRPDTY